MQGKGAPVRRRRASKGEGTRAPAGIGASEFTAHARGHACCRSGVNCAHCVSERVFLLVQVGVHVHRIVRVCAHVLHEGGKANV